MLSSPKDVDYHRHHQSTVVAQAQNGESHGGSSHAPNVTQTSQGDRPKVYHTGWRLHVLTTALCLSLLLSTLETTIVSTALVPIVDALHGFQKANWIVTSYLVTYTGFLIIYSKLSDIFGSCGASNSMVPLIVFRALQGVGGSGIYSLSTVIVPLMVPPRKYSTYIAIVSSTFAISSVLGPLLGGAIADQSSWRWVFYLNGPGGAVAGVLLAVSVPFGFPYGSSNNFFHTLVADKAWKRIDFVGAILSLAASVVIIFALEQGGTEYPWDSATIIVTFVLSGVLWIAFSFWQRRLSLRRRIVCEPIFPWSLTGNRLAMGLLLNSFMTGFPFMAAIINIPQRLQVVSMTSATNAGIRMLPLLLLSPVATAMSGALVSKLRIPPLYVLLLGTSLQTIGVGLFSSLDSSTTIPPAQYGYEALMGLGFGCNLSTVLMMVPLVVPEKNLAVTMGAVTQVRVLGGTVGLAVCSALLMSRIKTQAGKVLDPEQVARILQSSENIALLPQELRGPVRTIYSDGYAEQMRIMLYFSLAAVLSLVLLVQRRPIRLEAPSASAAKGT